MLSLRAPAKLNLYLRVLGKRPDGFHEIETVFERIDLADELAFESNASGGVELTCTDPALSCGPDNLIIKAAHLLRQLTRTSQGARIHLTKQIPIAAGLGGGSSDGAAALKGLNRLWQLGLDDSALVNAGSTLGSDVPFFLTESVFALGQGRGERCEPVATTMSLAHVLVVPLERLSTAEVYADGSFDRESRDDLTASIPSINMVLHALHNGSRSELAQGLWNDLEPVAIRRCPVIAVIQTRLRDLGCLEVCVSGSGTSVFGLCANSAQAREVADRLQQATTPWRIKVIHSESFRSKAPVTTTRWGVV